ncbi:MAG: hypothetical protein ABIJ42_08855, partial [Acidobacteriota bacterium]
GVLGGITGLLIGSLFVSGVGLPGHTLFLQVVGISLFLALAGAWIPSYAGVSRDPALVLMED